MTHGDRGGGPSGRRAAAGDARRIGKAFRHPPTGRHRERNVSWAGTPIPPQAGVAAYQRGKTGRLAAAPIYDDVDPPMA